MMRNCITLALLMAAMAGNGWALELNRYFSDGMVLQRDKPTVIRGTAEKGTEVTVEFSGQKKAAKVDENGNWSVTLDPMPANTQVNEADAKKLVAWVLSTK